jgi:hypothetical protein
MNNKENILLYCHSSSHNRSIIYKTLIKDKNKKYRYSYNDITGKDNDIKINLAANKVYNKDYLNKYYKKNYNIIWMVRCPFEVYINDNGKLRKSLFKNFKKLLHKDGVIITTIGDLGKLTLLKKYLKNPKESILEKKNIQRLIRKIVEMLAFKLKLNLLSIEENKKYVIKNRNYPYNEYFIFKKLK